MRKGIERKMYFSMPMSADVLSTEMRSKKKAIEKKNTQKPATDSINDSVSTNMTI